MPPANVKPYMKRRKNDAASLIAWASALVFRARDLLVRRRTQTINAIRGHVAEYGWVAPRGPSWVTKLGDLVEGEVAALDKQIA